MVTYGSLNLTVTSPVQSFDEPITLEQAKQYLELPERDPADSEEDDQIELFIKAARNIAEIEQGRDLVRKQWDLSFDYFPCHEIPLRDPLVSVDLVKYRNSVGNYTTLTADDDYIVDTAKHPGIVLPPYGESWPSFTAWPSSAVLIRFTSGYESDDSFWTSDAGTFVRKGMLYLISGWFTNRIPYPTDGSSFIAEYPFAANLLRYGRLERVR
jgi:uncharacterized phiE125 gp8 family phage protein